MQMTDEHYVPPSPDMSNLVPDGFEHVTTGGPMLGDFVLWRGQWEPLRVLGGRLFEYQMVIRRKPPQKKARPLNAEEWRGVGCCLLASPAGFVGGTVSPMLNALDAETYEHYRATCHPPGYPDDTRKLYVEVEE